MDKMEKDMEQRHGCEKGLPSWPKKIFLKIPAKTPREALPLFAGLQRDSLKQGTERLE